VKKLSAVLVGVLVVWGLAANAPVLGFFGTDGISGIPSFSSNWGRGVCDTKCDPGRGLMAAPTLYVGWLEHRKGSTWALKRSDETGTASWPLKGLWLGISKDVACDRGFGLILSGSVFIPRKSAGAWFTQPLTSTFDFDIPSYEWWSADGLAKFRVAGDVDLLAGLRWDHTSTRVSYIDNTDDDYILNTYVPLFGLQVHQQSSNGSLLVRFVGSPWIAGRLRYHFWTGATYTEFGDFNVINGYFMELLADYSVKVMGDLSVGVFARGNALHLNTAEKGLSGGTTEPISWTVDIRSWTLGGTMSLAFASPI